MDCLEKLKILTLAVTGTDFFQNYADLLTSHQYITVLNDLAEIGYYRISNRAAFMALLEVALPFLTKLVLNLMLEECKAG